MSSIALGMQVNELEARIVKLEGQVSKLLAILDNPIHTLNDDDSVTGARLTEIEAKIAMMRHAIDVAVLPRIMDNFDTPPKPGYATIEIRPGEQGTEMIYRGPTVAPYVPPTEDPFPINDSPMGPVKPASIMDGFDPRAGGPNDPADLPVKPAKVKATRA